MVVEVVDGGVAEELEVELVELYQRRNCLVGDGRPKPRSLLINQQQFRASEQVNRSAVIETWP